MKRKMDWLNEEEEDGEELSDKESSDDDNEEEEPRIKLVLQELPGSASQKYASKLLHSMAASRNILFWTLGGELLRNQRRVPRTSIVELIEYVLLPYDQDIPEPRALNSFLDGLAELGVDKRWIGNKKVLSELLQKEKENIQDQCEEGDQSENSDEETDDSQESQESQESSENEQVGEGNVSEEDSDVEEREASQTKKHFCAYCGHFNVDVKSIVGCPKCRWHEGHFDSSPRFNQPTRCCICNHEFPLNYDTVKSFLMTCKNCHAISHHHNTRSSNDDDVN